MYSLIVIALSCAVVFLLQIAFNKSIIKKPELVLKVMAVVFGLVGLVRFFLSDTFPETALDFVDPFQVFLRWGYYTSYAIIPISIFMDSRLFRNIASYFTLPVALVATFAFEDTFAYFTAEGAGGYYVDVTFRYCFYILELVLAISLPVLMQLQYKHVINLKDKKEILNIIAALPCIHIQMMPVYVPQSIKRDPGLSMDMFGDLHLGWIVLLVAECVLLHYFFRKRSEKDKYLLLVFLVLAQMFNTNSAMLRGMTLSRLPLQLCSIAAFFYFYTIITKSRKMFNFCYLANLVGGVIAIALAAFDVAPLQFWNIHYMYEHTFVMLVPILAMSLGVFPHLDRHAILDMLKYFTLYFVLAFIGGSILNGLDPTPGYYPVNCFYMFDLKRALQFVPFVGFVGNVHWEFGGFDMYPILVGIIYVVFVGLNMLFFGFTQGLYKISSLIRGKRPAPKEQEVKEPVEIA